MLARTYSVGLLGIEGFLVTVESAIGPGLARTLGVGVTGGPLFHAIARVGQAVQHCGHPLPSVMAILNLAPANQRKDSPGHDLAMACALLVSHGVVPAESLADTLLWGEVTADGQLRAAPGALIVAETAYQLGFRKLLVAEANAHEAQSSGLELVPVTSLAELVAYLRGECSAAVVASSPSTSVEVLPDMAELHELASARRGVELMIAGGHGLIVHGPRCASMSRLIERIAGLTVELDEATLHARARLASVVGERLGPPVSVLSPETSPSELIAEHGSMRPGPASLAHGGVLVLDTLSRFPPPLLAAVEAVARGFVRGVYPTNFVVMATMQPSRTRRFDLLIERCDLVAEVEMPELTDLRVESSETIRSRIALARARQRERWRETSWKSNSDMPLVEWCVNEFCATTPAAAAQLGQANDGCYRVRARALRVARTLADLDPDRDPRAPLDHESIATALRFTRCSP